MTLAVMNHLWKMHDDTKSLFRFTFKSASRYLQKIHDEYPEKNIASSASDSAFNHRDDQQKPRPYNTRQKIGLILGPLLFLAILLMPIPSMLPEAQKMAAIAALMATWWICESIPIPVTSLVPIVLFPLMGIMQASEATAPYGNHLIFLFMGGFIIALSMQRWHLHKRIAMHVVKAVGFSPSRLVLGFMLATALLSAFISNTATTLMMMPIGLAIIMHVLEEVRKEGGAEGERIPQSHSAFGINLMLGIAYAASIGGVATIIGTPPNIVLVGYLNNTYGLEITFAQWLLIGVPFVVVFLPLCWIWLTRFANPMKLKKLPGGKALIHDELEKMGKMSVGEKWTAFIFSMTALGWIFRQQIALFFPEPSMVTDATIAIFGAVLLFIIPINFKQNKFVMNWKWAVKLPWGILILFGGGLALAAGFQETGLANWIGEQIQFLEYAPMLLIIIVAITLIIFLTELTSNVATTAMILPVYSAVALAIGQSPLLLLIPAAIAASCAFMLPVATPPNAIVFGSGCVTMPSMVRSGFGLNIIGIAIVTALTYIIVKAVFGIEFGIAPAEFLLD